MNKRHSKGFTLIELLIVIAIVSILALVVVLTLNPGQLLAQGRDSARISDMGTLKSAIALYLADVSSPSLGAANTCYGSSEATPAASGCGGRMTASTVATSSTPTDVDGGGWIPINLTAISSGSPLGTLPLDPVNNATYFYSYAVDTTNTTYELNANMESTKYSSGADNIEDNDGGNSTSTYEVGTDPGLDL